MSGAAKDTKASVAAVVVTHDPDIDALVRTLLETSRQVSRIVVVDNASKSQLNLQQALETLPDVAFVGLDENHGIASALNHGVRELTVRGYDYSWLLTLDQDTSLHPRAICIVLSSLDLIDVRTRQECGIVGLRYEAVELPRGFTRWTEPSRHVHALGHGLREKRLLITSGNLVRRQVAEAIQYEESFFMDQVDHAFCASVRSHGWRVLEYDTVLMNHQIGKPVEVRGMLRQYEPGQRLYYIVRNSTSLLLHRQLPARFYIVQLLSWSGAYALVNGLLAIPRELMIVLAGLWDGILGRLGQRQYRFLAEPRAR
jgi:rhamnosyltransferase